MTDHHTTAYRPLTTWICDRCGGLIIDAHDGNVVWQDDESGRAHDFRIVHKGECDPYGSHTRSESIAFFLGEEGQARLLTFLSVGPIKTAQGHPGGAYAGDLDEFVDVFRRLQTPWYEQARQRFHTETVLGQYRESDESYPYRPDALEKIARGQV